MALNQRYWSHDADSILTAQTSLANCLSDLGRHDEALSLNRKIHARSVAIYGASHEHVILSGFNVVNTLGHLGLFDEMISLTRDQLLPAARRTLGNDDNITLGAKQNLAEALRFNPKCTRGDLRLNQHDVLPQLIPTQATTCSKPRLSCRT